MFSGFWRGFVSAESVGPAAEVKVVEPTPEEESTDVDQNTDSTPKARPSQPAVEIPTFTLGSEQESEGQSLSDKASYPNIQVSSGSDMTPLMPPPPPLAPSLTPRPSQSVPASSLMPPPVRPASLPNRNATAALRVPSTGPLPNRGLPANSQQRVSTTQTTNGAASALGARGKVLLSPGHSPMDWAALTRRSNLSGVETFRRVTPSELRKMTGRKGKPAWSSWHNKVYNITPYLPFHPGGEPELMKAAGRDGTKLFMDVHPWVNWENMLESCLVGVMVPEDYGKGDGSSLEDMD